jgi:hypothetical protein
MQHPFSFFPSISMFDETPLLTWLCTCPFFPTGIARSKSVRSPDDGIGPKDDEFFTVSLGGMATLLNNSGRPISAGDLIEWCLVNDFTGGPDPHKRTKSGPRRIAVKTASVSSDKLIGRALS